jgi:hypothetical protein
MGYSPCLSNVTLPLIRPKILIETARIGARLYCRKRDLPGAIPQLKFGLPASACARIVARLSEAERDCESLRRDRSPAYRSGKHVQILSALIAEADLVASRGSTRPAAQTKASGADDLRLAM